MSDWSEVSEYSAGSGVGTAEQESILPRAGWYQDPASDASLRWWDGAQWTADTRPKPAPSQAAVGQISADFAMVTDTPGDDPSATFDAVLDDRTSAGSSIRAAQAAAARADRMGVSLFDAEPEAKALAGELDRPSAPTEPESPFRLCRKCSTQARTSGDFCPHCGARYSKLRRSPKQRLLRYALPLIVVLAGCSVAVVLIVHHNNQVGAQKRAAATAAARSAAAQRAAAASRRRLQAAQAKAHRDLVQIERASMVSQLQTAVKGDAVKDVNDGVLTGPILKVQCEPATSADATAPIANYTCLAAKTESGGTLEGYRFSALLNTNTGSISWHLGG